MMIEDDELREVFKIASEEHLQQLEDGLLHLEKHPDDREKLDALLREAHSLKGDAGMLGVKDVATLSHQFEHLLGGIKRGEMGMSPEISDRLYQGLDGIRKLVNEALTGEPAGVNTFYLLATLMGASGPEQGSEMVPGSDAQGEDQQDQEDESEGLARTDEGFDLAEVELATPVSLPEVSPHAEPAPAVNPLSAPPKSTTPAAQPSYRIETIRVPTRNLDTLMTQAGELTVTKIRLAHRLTEIEEITTLWEEWSRDTFLNRFLLNEEDANGNTLGQTSHLGQLQNYHHRAQERVEQLGQLINQLRTAIYEDTARLDLIATELEEGIRTLRLLPLSTIFNLYPRMVRDLARLEAKEVELIIEGGDTKADKRILEEMKDPLMHMIRNAVDHGIESPDEREAMGKPRTAKIHLRGYHTATNIVIEVSDDGRGFNLEQIRQTALKRGISTEEELATMTSNQIQSLIFASGFSTRSFVTEVSGRGVGLDVVRTNVEALKGSIQVDSVTGQRTTFRIQLGTTLATAHVLIVIVSGITYALPVEFVETTRLVSSDEIFTIEGRETIIHEGQPISVVFLVDLLELSGVSSTGLLGEHQQLPCIILRVGEDALGVFVDALVDEQDVVLKPQSQVLKRVRNVAGATILGTGEVCMVLNPQDMLKSARKQGGGSSRVRAMTWENTEISISTKQSILLVEDSIAIRTQEKRILEAAGYEVVTAVDGVEALTKLRNRSFDAVVSDIQMPNLDGLELTNRIRQQSEYSELPIILVTSLASDEDKRRGAEAGANAYITKGTFSQEVLLETLKRLV